MERTDARAPRLDARLFPRTGARATSVWVVCVVMTRARVIVALVGAVAVCRVRRRHLEGPSNPCLRV